MFLNGSIVETELLTENVLPPLTPNFVACQQDGAQSRCVVCNA